MNHKHEDKYCPRCGNTFVCRAGDLIHCQCSGVKLDQRTLEFLDNRYDDCLCQNCLIEIDQLIKTAAKHRFPSHQVLLIEGLHYYKEGDTKVFTALYHLLRGYCCKSSCRHCVYGYQESTSD